ncbi:NlpC/P60 family protein [Parasediminibacterium paludis]|uniref:NlpC/P60 family protein n=1 Tax=Parasediminibacterium paludis TaxID=908966 RepID=A0ABV8PR53_9BACT
MRFVASIVAVCPIRKEPDHKSEMTSQLLLGEHAEVLEVQKEFVQIKCLYDGYIGWCQRVQLAFTNDFVTSNQFVVNAFDNVHINQQPCRVSFAMPVFRQALLFDNFEIDYKNIATLDAVTNTFSAENITRYTSIFLNTPYLWGGRTLFGIDCSGFAQQVYKLFNKQIPRDAYQQAELGEALGFLEEAICGDLAFFDNEAGLITHVGIILNNHQIIHASGRVRIDTIDSAGIISSDTGLRTHHLRVVKRY